MNSIIMYLAVLTAATLPSHVVAVAPPPPIAVVVEQTETTAPPVQHPLPAVNKPAGIFSGIKSPEKPRWASYQPLIVEPPTISELVASTWPDDAEEAWRIMMCESGGNPDAHGDLHLPHLTDGYGSVGLFQINVGNILYTPMDVLAAWQTDDPTEAIRTLTDPETNIRIAFVLWNTSGQTFAKHWVNCST